MIWEWKSNFEFLDIGDENSSNSALKENLSKISTNEIQNLKNRINFYLAHFIILSRKANSQSSEVKMNYLKKLNYILEQEIECRQRKVYL